MRTHQRTLRRNTNTGELSQTAVLCGVASPVLCDRAWRSHPGDKPGLGLHVRTHTNGTAVPPTSLSARPASEPPCLPLFRGPDRPPPPRGLTPCQGRMLERRRRCATARLSRRPVDVAAVGDFGARVSTATPTQLVRERRAAPRAQVFASHFHPSDPGSEFVWINPNLDRVVFDDFVNRRRVDLV